MLSLTDATRLLASSTNHDALTALLARFGFATPLRTLDAAACERLGLPTGIVVTARVARGDGVLRALVVDLADTAGEREALSLIARRLASRVPHLLWLVVTRRRSAPMVSIAAWHATDRVSVAALIVDGARVSESDAETVCALAACAVPAMTDTMRHVRWMEVLGRESVTRRFFLALAGSVGALADSLPPPVPAPHARELALLVTCRLLFLAFLETKGWLAGDFAFLANGFGACMGRGGDYHRRVLEPLFFGTLNTRPADRARVARAFGAIPFLNGGLFTRTVLERQHRNARLSDDALGALFGDVLVRYRFTPRESDGAFTDSAIDPEMLGKAFESLMASDDRKRQGVFYTPQPFVERLVALALPAAVAHGAGDEALLADVMSGGRVADDAMTQALLARLRSVRVLDPACGSGAFLVHLLERIAAMRIALGEAAPLAAVRRSVLETSIHGVDVNPTAVWLCQLRLWLATVIDADERDPMRVRPLPNLDRQIRVGDSLSGAAFGEHDARAATSGVAIATLRRRYVSATGRRKATLARALDRAERARGIAAVERELARAVAERRELVSEARGRDLFRARRGLDAAGRAKVAELRARARVLRARRDLLRRGGALPFSYPVHFAESAEGGGFDAVVGNPPWVRVHRIAAADREAYRQRYRVLRGAAWVSGADACAGRGFAAQGDLAALFVERAAELVRPGGVVSFLLPSKLWRSLAGGGVRELVATRLRMVALEDHADAPATFDAVAYPSLFVGTRVADIDASDADRLMMAGAHRRDGIDRWRAGISCIAYDRTPGAPWLLVPPDVRRAFECLRAAGIPMAETALGRPWLGVKSGYNAAFVVRASGSGDPVSIESGDVTGRVERALLRPVVRGESLTPWRIGADTMDRDTGEWIVWTHDAAGDARRELPRYARAWLSLWRRELERRSDARRAVRWWSLFRTEAADASAARVVWNDIGRSPRAAVVLPGDPLVPLNSCYVARCPSTDDAYALTALLNAPIVAAWLSVLAEPARGGYRRYLAWTVAAMPVPRGWAKARSLLAPLAYAAASGMVPSGEALDAAVLEAYGVSRGDVAALDDWARDR